MMHYCANNKERRYLLSKVFELGEKNLIRPIKKLEIL